MTRVDDAVPDDWHEIEALWETVRDMPPAQLDAFLASNAAYGALRAELESLLERASGAEPLIDRTSAVVPQSGEAIAAEDVGSRDTANVAEGWGTSAHVDADPLIGTTVGHYEIAARLGQGGMGVVYRALDLRLRRTVALKLLRAQTSHSLRAKDRLLVEARAAAALDHANICTIYEVGETAEHSAFIAMAFYPGETLEQVMQRGPLPLAIALDYATQIARGLGAAHVRGIIHRDVKPANIIIAADGVVKLLDFGIARVPDVDVSREGVTPGTIAFMSPEQVASRPLDSRTDLWSLGVVLYEMCTGERPFRGDNVGAVLYAILHASPAPPSTLRGDLPASVDSILARLLAKDPSRRYSNAEELISDLARSAGVASELATRAGEHQAARAAAILEPATVRPRKRWVRHVVWYGVAAVTGGALIATWRGARTPTENMRRMPSDPAPANHAPDSATSARRIHAQDLYAQGRRDVLFRTDSGRRLARDLFRQAIAADSTYAPAHASLAIFSVTPGTHHLVSLAEAEESARTAIRLDSLLPTAHAALGRVVMLNYRFAEARAHLTRAVELDPKSNIREFLIWLYVFMDRPRDALAEAEEFLRFNPSSSSAITEMARGLLVNGRCNEALARLDHLKQLQPPPARTGNIAAQCHARRKEWPQAIAAIRSVAETNKQALAYLGFMLARGDRTDSARAIRDTLLARHRRGEATAYDLGVVHAGLGDFESAFQWLDRAYDERSLRPDIMEPLFEELQQDPRFDALRRKLGIQQR